MKIAYFDCFSGIAGDMALAALLDCGVPLDELKKGLASLPVAGWDIACEDVLRSGIHAKSVSITQHGITDEQELQTLGATMAPSVTAPLRELPHEHSHFHQVADPHHDHQHHESVNQQHNAQSATSHHHEHSHTHEHHEPSHSHEHEHHHGRSMREIRDIIEGSALGAKVKAGALAIFEKIAVAEAYLHHSTPDEVHFHEIGGLDSLLDIVGVAWCLDYLGVEAVYASALPLSSGWVNCAHGKMPVPAPATLEILKGAPWTPTEVRGELVTPTGAGILAALAREFGNAPALRIEKIGLGAGKKEFADRPNILRVSLGQASEQTGDLGLEWTTLALLETNIDDMNPQLFESVFESLFDLGALDVWTTPIGMKKGRAAQTLSVLCEQKSRDAVLTAILRETTTLGVRLSAVQRASVAREIRRVSTPYGDLRVKVARWDAQDLQRVHPEWDDVKRLARETGTSAREVFEAAMRAAL